MHLEILNKRNKVSVSCYKDYSVEFWCELNGINCHTYIPIGFFASPSENLEIFCFGFDAHFSEGFEKRFFIAGFRRDDVCDCTNKRPVTKGVLEDLAKIYP